MLRLIRHGQSTANGENAIARGNPNAELTELGIEQSVALREPILAILGERAMDLSVITVGASQLRRSQQTAEVIGFTDIRPTKLLDESSEAMPLRYLIPKLKEGWLPSDTLHSAEEFLSDPALHYEFNFSHGLFIASCRYVAGERPVDGDLKSLVPYYAEMVEINT